MGGLLGVGERCPCLCEIKQEKTAFLLPLDTEEDRDTRPGLKGVSSPLVTILRGDERKEQRNPKQCFWGRSYVSSLFSQAVSSLE